MKKVTDFFKGMESIARSIFVPNNEELLHFYWGAVLFLLINTYITALATLVTVTILAFGLSLWRYFNKQKPFLLKTILFAIVPLALWFLALTINKWL